MSGDSATVNAPPNGFIATSRQTRHGLVELCCAPADLKAGLELLRQFDQVGYVEANYPELIFLPESAWTWYSLHPLGGKWIVTEPDFDGNPCARNRHFVATVGVVYSMDKLVRRLQVDAEMPDYMGLVFWKPGTLEATTTYLVRPTLNRMFNDSGWYMLTEPVWPSNNEQQGIRFMEKQPVYELIKTRPGLVVPMALPTGQFMVKMENDQIAAVFDREGKDVWAETGPTP